MGFVVSLVLILIIRKFLMHDTILVFKIIILLLILQKKKKMKNKIENVINRT